MASSKPAPCAGVASSGGGEPKRVGEDRLAALRELLDRPGGPSLDVVRGLLAAVVSAPGSIRPRVWLEIAFGDRSLPAGREDLVQTLLDLHDEIALELAAGGEVTPLADAGSPTERRIEDFCVGYMIGVELDPSWEKAPEATAALLPIAVLARECPIGALASEDEDPEEALTTLRRRLPDFVREAFRRAGRPAPARPTRRLGGKEPCPCGSGKRYKRCCGPARARRK